MFENLLGDECLKSNFNQMKMKSNVFFLLKTAVFSIELHSLSQIFYYLIYVMKQLY